jgi:hypothetical protein
VVSLGAQQPVFCCGLCESRFTGSLLKKRYRKSFSYLRRKRRRRRRSIKGRKGWWEG